MEKKAGKERLFFQRNLPIWLFIFGIAFRLKHFLDNRSLWLDESYLGIDVQAQSLRQILMNLPCLEELPLPPMGFMFLEKIAVMAGGNNEYALRFFPLVVGVAAMFLFFRLAKRHLDNMPAVVALALFTFSPHLIYYAAEVKQYGLDVFIALMVFFAFGNPAEKNVSKGRFYSLVCLGAIAVSCSHPAAFTLAAYGSIRFFVLWRRKDWPAMMDLVVQAIVWLLVFGLWYLNSFQHMFDNEQIIGDTLKRGYFFPLFSGWQAVTWLGRNFVLYFDNPGGWKWVAVPAVLAVLGIRALWRQDRIQTLFFLLPLGIALLASAMQKYSFIGRLLLFTVPALFIFVSKGLFFLSKRAGKHQKAVAIFLLVALLAEPVRFAALRFASGIQIEESRPLVQHMKEHFKSQDVIIVNEFAKLPLTYYLLQKKKIPQFDLITVTNRVEQDQGRDAVPSVFQRYFFSQPEKLYIFKDDQFLSYISDEEIGALVAARGRKKWILFTHSYPCKEIVLNALRRISTFQYEQIEPGAELYVFSEN